MLPGLVIQIALLLAVVVGAALTVGLYLRMVAAMLSRPPHASRKRGARALHARTDAEPFLGRTQNESSAMLLMRMVGRDGERLLAAARSTTRALGKTGILPKVERFLVTPERAPHETVRSLRSEPPAGATGNVFHREGEYWTLAYAGRTFHLRDTKGLHCIARLLTDPGTEVHVGDLVVLDGGTSDNTGDTPRPGNLGTVLDPRARAEYKQRLDDLRDELEEATAGGELARADRARNELELIAQELAAAYGLGRRPRRIGDPAERWRKAVTNQIRRSLQRIRAEDPALGLHLTKALRTGFFCSYTPERPIAWQL